MNSGGWDAGGMGAARPRGKKSGEWENCNNTISKTYLKEKKNKGTALEKCPRTLDWTGGVLVGKPVSRYSSRYAVSDFA